MTARGDLMPAGESSALGSWFHQWRRWCREFRGLLPGGRFVGAVLVLALTLFAGPLAAKDSASVKLFNKTCAPCHSKDGRARTPAARKLGVKDLKLSKLSDKQIVFQILEGRQDTTKKSKMPAFKDTLTKEQIDQLIPVVKAFRK